MDARRDALLEIAEANKPATVRNLYYRAVVAGIVPKTEAGYGRVQRTLAQMRRDGQMPFAWIVDNARWMRKPKSHNGIAELLDDAASLYRRDLWRHTADRVEVWCESDSIAGVLYPVTAKWDVPLFPVRGFSSLSFTHGAAVSANADGRNLHVYYVGDLDPAGLDIERSLMRDLEGWLDVPLFFERVGVTWAQTTEHHLPGTTPKKAFAHPIAVEAEALPAPVLRELLEQVLVQHVDGHELEVLRTVEEEERKALRLLAWEHTS